MKDGKRTIAITPALRAAIGRFDCVRAGRLIPAIERLNALADGLPDRYHWRFKTADAFREELSEVPRGKGAIRALNALYWRDTLATLEAYGVMAVWRMVDMGQSAARAIEEENLVPAGVLARSALESAIQFVHDARTMSATLEDISKHDLSKHVATSEELEAFILQTVYASRQSGAEDIYKSKNILTIIEKIAKIAKHDPLREKYELLCELTHPNFLGRSLYINGVEGGTRPGDELRSIGHQNGVTSDLILEALLWSLSWAFEAQGSALHLLQGSIQKMFASFDFLTARRRAKSHSKRLQ